METAYSKIPHLRKLEIEYLAIQISRAQSRNREFLSQSEAYSRFGRGNVDRWVREGSLQRYKRPGKIEYRIDDLYKAALNPYDY